MYYLIIDHDSDSVVLQFIPVHFEADVNPENSSKPGVEASLSDVQPWRVQVIRLVDVSEQLVEGDHTIFIRFLLDGTESDFPSDIFSSTIYGSWNLKKIKV